MSKAIFKRVEENNNQDAQRINCADTSEMAESSVAMQNIIKACIPSSLLTFCACQKKYNRRKHVIRPATINSFSNFYLKLAWKDAWTR